MAVNVCVNVDVNVIISDIFNSDVAAYIMFNISFILVLLLGRDTSHNVFVSGVCFLWKLTKGNGFLISHISSLSRQQRVFGMNLGNIRSYLMVHIWP